MSADSHNMAVSDDVKASNNINILPWRLSDILSTGDCPITLEFFGRFSPSTSLMVWSVPNNNSQYAKFEEKNGVLTQRTELSQLQYHDTS